MTKPLIGSVYQVEHKDKGVFCIVVRFTDSIFTTGRVIKGKVKASEEKNEKGIGDQVTVRNTFCEFVKIREPETDSDKHFIHYGKKKGKES